MPRNPYTVLELPLDASTDAIKGAWRRLARQHHPDIASGDPLVEKRSNRKMAEINAAYQELRDPEKRRIHRDAAARASWPGPGGATAGPVGAAPREGQPPEWPGTPRRPLSGRPVTARIDTSTLLRPRNSVLHPLDHSPLPGLPPRPRSAGDHEPRRASTPTGPMHRRRGPNMDADLPILAEALETRLGFGKFAGYTLKEVAEIEPTYIEWIVRTISRDPETSLAARVVLRHLVAGTTVMRPRLDTYVPRG
ncbi:MAG TPA: J domain-containing protein [Candidatus Limnocylindrales bacterium]